LGAFLGGHALKFFLKEKALNLYKPIHSILSILFITILAVISLAPTLTASPVTGFEPTDSGNVNVNVNQRRVSPDRYGDGRQAYRHAYGNGCSCCASY